MATYDIFCQVGQSIGMIRKSQNENGQSFYRLDESDIRVISLTKKGVRVYTKFFIPLYDRDIRSATEMMLDRNIIFIQEPFLLTDKAREKAQRWIDLVNENAMNAHKEPD